MIDHPNKFPIGQQVLFRSRSGSGDHQRWIEGTVVVVRAADTKDKRREAPSPGSNRWEATQRLHSQHGSNCEFVYYDVLPEGARFDEVWEQRVQMLCVCSYDIVPAADPTRWTGQKLTTRSQYTLLLADLAHDGLEYQGHAHADNTVHLMVEGRLYATIDTNDLLNWAAG